MPPEVAEHLVDAGSKCFHFAFFLSFRSKGFGADAPILFVTLTYSMPHDDGGL